MRTHLLILLLAAPPELVSSQRYDNFDEELLPLVELRQAQIFIEADACVSELGTSLGVAFLDCVLGRLEAAEREYVDKDEDDGGPFPVPPYTRNPLTIGEDSEDDPADEDSEDDPANHPRMLMDLLRNYTCARDVDGGSPVVDKVGWVFDEAKVMSEQAEQQSCPADLGDADGWEMAEGYLSLGHDVGDTLQMDVETAKRHCDGLPQCEGFTFETVGGADLPEIYFKGRADITDIGADNDWEAHVRKRIPGRCKVAAESDDEESPKEFAPPREYTVEILRREPLVAVIPDFASEDDCNLLIEKGGSFDEMGRAYEDYGPSSYRRSYSSNIDVDYEDTADPVTRLAERMFAFVRHITGYDVSGPGQEPINAVLYRDIGDEYRPHCDGPCDGEDYEFGKRVATSILYCQTPEGGGQTSFTRSGMMVSPRPRDLLLFAYKYENGTMDTGFTEHSGCPITGGHKWIATQWYREAVDYEHPWNTVDNEALVDGETDEVLDDDVFDDDNVDDDEFDDDDVDDDNDEDDDDDE